MAMKPGEIVQVEVASTHAFGLFCHRESEQVLVVIPETSWIASFNSCEQFADPGDRFNVVILNVDQGSGRIAGSIRQAAPNPWKAGSFRVGQVCEARVARFVPRADRCGDQPAYLVELLPGAYAMLCASGITLTKGQLCQVLIQSVDQSRSAVSVILAEE